MGENINPFHLKMYECAPQKILGDMKVLGDIIPGSITYW